MRTIQPSLSPIPNTTTFGEAGTVYVQLFYAGVEQFYCEADTCSQTLGNGTSSANWDCQNLRCTCRRGTTFCGGPSAADLTQVINSLAGNLGIHCDGLNNSTDTATCQFQQKDLLTLFPPSGLTLNGCTFGECVRQSVIDTGGNITAPVTAAGKPLSGGVIAGLAVVGALVLLALLFILFGYIRQRRARNKQQSDNAGMQVGVCWEGITYTIVGSSSFFGLFRNHEERNVLDNVSGSVMAGQMMAILGPSGEPISNLTRCYQTPESYRSRKDHSCRDSRRQTQVRICSRKRPFSRQRGFVGCCCTKNRLCPSTRYSPSYFDCIWGIAVCSSFATSRECQGHRKTWDGWRTHGEAWYFVAEGCSHWS